MLIRRHRDVEPVPYTQGIEKRVVLGPRQGIPTFVMRVFDVPPGASTPYHKHDWEHEVFVLTGSGTAVMEAGGSPVGPQDAVFVPAGELHCFKNAGAGTFQFICLVPVCGEDTP